MKGTDYLNWIFPRGSGTMTGGVGDDRQWEDDRQNGRTMIEQGEWGEGTEQEDDDRTGRVGRGDRTGGR